MPNKRVRRTQIRQKQVRHKKTQKLAQFLVSRNALEFRVFRLRHFLKSTIGPAEAQLISKELKRISKLTDRFYLSSLSYEKMFGREVHDRRHDVLRELDSLLHLLSEYNKKHPKAKIDIPWKKGVA